MRLQDKVAIVTGAASGIGEAVTKRFLDEGAKVVVVDLKDETELAQRFPDSAGRVLALKADVTKREDLERIVSTTVDKFGGIDILFNNAALFDMRPILDESWDIFDRLFSVNVKGMFFLMQLVAQRMVEQGRGGKIVNMSSQAGRRGEALVSHYCATKAAVISYTQSAALGLANQPFFLAERAVFVLREKRVNRLPHRGIDNARCDAVHVDAMLRETQRG